MVGVEVLCPLQTQQHDSVNRALKSEEEKEMCSSCIYNRVRYTNMPIALMEYNPWYDKPSPSQLE